MESHLDTFSGGLRKPVKDVQVPSDSTQQATLHHIYNSSSVHRNSSTMSRIDSLHSDDSDLDPPGYNSDESSAAPEIVVWSGEVERDGMDSDEDSLSSLEALDE